MVALQCICVLVNENLNAQEEEEMYQRHHLPAQTNTKNNPLRWSRSEIYKYYTNSLAISYQSSYLSATLLSDADLVLLQDVQDLSLRNGLQMGRQILPHGAVAVAQLVSFAQP